MNNVNFPYPKFRWTRCFITRVASISYHPSRNFPDTRKRYTVFVGRSFWRLVMFVYATSVNSWTARKTESSKKADKKESNAVVDGQDEEQEDLQPMNALITGIRGCGKSHLLMTAAAFLTARNTTDLYKIVCIGDCRSWIHSDNPVAFFTLELMLAFQNNHTTHAKTKGQESDDDSSKANSKKKTLNDGNYSPPTIFTAFSDLKRWMEAVGERLAKHDEMRLVIFIDQLEEIYSNMSSNPNAQIVSDIIDLLIGLKYPIMIASMIPINLPLPPALRDRKVFAEMKMPASITYTDFDMFVELFECSKRLSDEDDSLLHDLRYWSGAVPAQITKFFTSTNHPETAADQSNASNRGLNHYQGSNCVASRLVRYRMERAKAFQDLVISAAGKLDRLPRMHLLLQIFRMLLHIPTEDPNISAPATATGLESLFVTAALQKFFHPIEGIIAYRHIPTAVTPAAHFSLADERFLHRLAPKWSQVLEALVASILNSKAVCLESKRRMIRFYAQLKLFQMAVEEPVYDSSMTIEGKDLDFCLSGVTQFNDPFEVRITGKQILRRVIFSGLSPTPCLIPSNKTSSTANNPLLFIPGRTDYPFYDFFIAIPAERCLYACSTIPYATATKHCAATINSITNSPLNPLSLLDMWCKDLKDADYSRFTAKYCHIDSMQLLKQLNSPYTPKIE